ncbi:MAG TPA: hypothetical protein DCZ72_01465 [Armatimonadetes bacterium]|nr:hypothetical protein [Armatimonadota bacterium]
MGLTSRERMARTLERQPVDQVPVAVSPWGTTVARWRAEGHLGEHEDPAYHFGQDLRSAGWLNTVADLDFTPEVLEETAETQLVRDGNGAVLRRHRLHEATPEHVDFAVQDRASWEALVKPLLLGTDRRRIPFEGYRHTKAWCEENEIYFTWSGVAPFELIHPICGHEYMLLGMADDPDWVRDMAETLSDLTIRCWDLLFTEEGLPQAVFFYEDMGFKGRPFMSPRMYEEILQPSHARLFDYAHERGLKVIVHSCGYVEPLVPGLIDAGLDCLQAMEVKAGMDLDTLFARFGDRIAFYGGLDVRTLIANDRAAIETELGKMVRVLEGGGGYVLHTDHSEPPEVNYETMRFFVDRGRELSAETFARLAAAG